MRGVDERLEVVGRAEARGGGKEGADVVAEGAVVRMLHDRHELDDVVAGLLHARKHVVAELRVGVDTLLLAAHADMRLIDERRLEPGRWRRVAPLVLRLVDLRAEEVGLGILNDVARIRGDSLAVPPFPAHFKTVVVTLLDKPCGDLALPDVGIRQPEALEARVDLPLGEVAHEPHARRVRRPFAEHPPALRAVKPVIFVRRGPVGKRALPRSKLACSVERMLRAPAYRRLERL